MPIGGDLSHNKCDNCNSFLVWNEFGDSRSDVSQLEEVCEECVGKQTRIKSKNWYKSSQFFRKTKTKRGGIKCQ